jgi:hypothetical protein
MIAFGDAENDIPVLLEAEVGVAARGRCQRFCPWSMIPFLSLVGQAWLLPSAK